MMKRIASLLIIIIAAFSFCSIEASAQKFQVRVVGVSDGDTFTGLNRDNLQLRFRINGIDAPEKKQAFGQKAKEHLSDMIYGKEITVDVQRADGWGRHIAYVYVDGIDVALKMVADGFAWHYVEYYESDTYAKAQENAKKRRLGLWYDANPTAPWIFRKQK